MGIGPGPRSARKSSTRRLKRQPTMPNAINPSAIAPSIQRIQRDFGSHAQMPSLERRARDGFRVATSASAVEQSTILSRLLEYVLVVLGRDPSADQLDP